VPEELPKAYEPSEVEEARYERWVQAGYFHPEAGRGRPFCIVIPPPNVTGVLHIGHALDHTFQDLVMRRRRMQGWAALWLPGTDHAGIATQNVVEREIARKGQTRYDLGREAFVERVWEWKDAYGGRILGQMRRLGDSVDWERLRFTLDDGCSKAVREVFARLYEEGLLYRGNRIINWCPRCLTALSDIEVEHHEVGPAPIGSDGKPSGRGAELVHIRYPFEDGSGHITVATTRAETMLGDMAVAVHPSDVRYAGAVGKRVVLPLAGRTIPVVADDVVEMEFGTGAVKVTPAHDPTDFEIGQRHGLEPLLVIDSEAHMTDAVPEVFRGLDRYAAREAVKGALAREGFLEKVEPYTHSVGHCYRCHTEVEPFLSLQWFVKVGPLAEPAMRAVRDGRIKFHPERWARTYLDWMENLRDWCVSRQIWWGHRVPAWYCPEEHITVARETPTACATCGSADLRQDADVLDTWFSSALWPFSTLGWPERTEALDFWYPTSVLVTGFDIITFWVSRMIMMGLHFTGEVPFGDVAIHGLVRDRRGKKMSKSFGNVVDPLAMIDTYGADALRFALARAVVPGNDVALAEEWIDGARHFANKLWNAGRYLLGRLGGDGEGLPALPSKLTLADRWLLSRLEGVRAAVDEAYETYDIGEVARGLQAFAWGELCDWGIELSKAGLEPVSSMGAADSEAEGAGSGVGGAASEAGTAGSAMGAANPRAMAPGSRAVLSLEVLAFAFERLLRLLHPIMPFVTEEIWTRLTGEDSLCVAAWPEARPGDADPEAESDLAVLQEVVSALRRFRAEHQIKPSARFAVQVHPTAEARAAVLERERAAVVLLTGTDPSVEPGEPDRSGKAKIVVSVADLYVPLEGLLDLEAERARLSKQEAKLASEAERVEAKLANADFLAKAPADVVDKQQVRLAELRESATRVRSQLDELG